MDYKQLTPTTAKKTIFQTYRRALKEIKIDKGRTTFFSTCNECGANVMNLPQHHNAVHPSLAPMPTKTPLQCPVCNQKYLNIELHIWRNHIQVVPSQYWRNIRSTTDPLPFKIVVEDKERRKPSVMSLGDLLLLA